MELSLYRQFYAEEVAAVCGMHSPELMRALAHVERESFLPHGPWMVRGEADPVPRPTPDADPRHVCHNYSIAIDASRQLFNGAPGVVAKAIDALDVQPGSQVLHVGAGLGYYTAVLAAMVRHRGRVLAYEADQALAEAARANLSAWVNVELRHGDTTTLDAEGEFDAILISAGVTHPLRSWLDRTRLGGRLVVPLTATFPGMGPLGKGVTLLLSKRSNDEFGLRSLGMTAIYSAVGIRDASMGESLGRAMQRMPYPRFTVLTLLPHEPTSRCWLHGEDVCIRQE